ncbi:MAG: hypothetical protein V9E82_03805 [Candidatus Nanopelagicales bacterium]
MSDSTITLLILAVVVVLFISNRFPVELVAIGAALGLYGAGISPCRRHWRASPTPRSC